MQPTKLSIIFFSATSTTRRCVDAVAASLDIPTTLSINLADREHIPLPDFTTEDAVIFAFPVYGGRLPLPVSEAISRINGNGARAIAMVVYGNRDYDDALLELTDIITERGFSVIAASAFIGQHSIFPKVGIGRPDKSDMEQLSEFGRQCARLLERDTDLPVTVKGKRPYKKTGSIPFHPVGERNKCKECGKCVVMCPADAIDPAMPWTTEPDKCISCGRCISVCSQSARHYTGLKYNLIGAIFKAAFSRRKEPETFIGR